MTEKEPKKASEILSQQITGVENLLKELKAQLSKTSTPEHEHVAMPESARGHKTIDEVVDCPNCKPKLLAKFRPEILKEFKEKLKSKEIVTCDGCGEFVEKTESECPSCHGHKAH